MWRQQSTASRYWAPPLDQATQGEKRHVAMTKPIIAVASSLTGLALMALVVSLQRNPLAWTHPAPPFPPPSNAPAKASNVQAPNEALPNGASVGVVTLPPIRITSPKPTTTLPENKLEDRALEPCSEWRELGPTYVEEGKPRGAQRVRHLC
jgi:hypothetical protein